LFELSSATVELRPQRGDYGHHIPFHEKPAQHSLRQM
jgi:hypothetical protein